MLPETKKQSGFFPCHAQRLVHLKPPVFAVVANSAVPEHDLVLFRSGEHTVWSHVNLVKRLFISPHSNLRTWFSGVMQNTCLFSHLELSTCWMLLKKTKFLGTGKVFRMLIFVTSMKKAPARRCHSIPAFLRYFRTYRMSCWKYDWYLAYHIFELSPMAWLGSGKKLVKIAFFCTCSLTSIYTWAER